MTKHRSNIAENIESVSDEQFRVDENPAQIARVETMVERDGAGVEDCATISVERFCDTAPNTVVDGLSGILDTIIEHDPADL